MINEKAYAKINLNLDILGKREDGYHELESVMCTIDLYDSLFFEVLEEDTIILKSNYTELDNQDNLIYRVAKYLKDDFNITKGIKITMHKNIPIAAGLAGGSSDAAATLRALNKIFSLKLSTEQLAAIGSLFGSDIPFCVYNQASVVKGRGEYVEPIENNMECYVLVVRQDFHVSTKEVFSNVKLYAKHTKTEKIKEALKTNNYQLLIDNISNWLEQTTTQLYPLVKDVINSIKNDGIFAMQSGSGPTVLAFSNKKEELEAIKPKLLEDFGLNAEIVELFNCR